MKKTKRFLGVIALCCAFATGSLAEDLTVVFDSATPTAPEGTASYGGGAKTDGSNAKLTGRLRKAGLEPSSDCKT